MAERPILTLAPVTAPSVADEAKQTVPSAAEQRSSPGGGSEDAMVTPNNGTTTRGARGRPRFRAEAKRGEDSAPERTPDLWREWGAFHQTVSFKWPSELVEELDDRRHDLREPVGLMVIAAVTHLLDQDDKTIHDLIDRAEQAKPRSGRARNRSR